MSAPRITLHEAADRLGVHYMTAYRYVRTGRLPATREGVQWMVEPDDLAELAVNGGRRPRGAARAAAPRTMAARLVAGDEAGAWVLVEAALASGAEPDEVLLDIIGAAMTEVGTQWEVGTIDVADEHRASGVAQRLVGRLGPRFARRGRKRGTIVVGAPAGEEHGLPTAMLADLLRGARFDVADLGADTPAASFALAAGRADRLQAVVLGITSPGHDRAVRAAFSALRRAGVGAPLLVGGSAVEDEAHAARLGADGWTGRDGRAAVAAVERAIG